MFLPNRKVKSLGCINLRAKALLSPQPNGRNGSAETSKGYGWRSARRKLSLWKVHRWPRVPLQHAEDPVGTGAQEAACRQFARGPG